MERTSRSFAVSNIIKIQIPRKILEEFCKRNHIVRFSLFGSALREDYRPDSDIDVLVVFEKNHVPGFIGLSRMERELSSILGGGNCRLANA